MADTARRSLTVGDMMHARMVSTTPDSPMAEAAAEMVRESVGSALVMQGPFLAGILTERDVLRAAASGHRPHRGAGVGLDDQGPAVGRARTPPSRTRPR